MNVGVGTSGQVLSSNAAGAPSWVAPNAGTVTNVTGTLPISVATGTTAPVISIATANTTTTGAISSTDWNTFNNKLTSTLNSGLINVGSAGNVATAVAMSGDATLANTGALTLNTVPATKGGTGQSVYVIGDLLYASTTSALSRLPAAATVGSVLTNNGTGVAPTWQVIPVTGASGYYTNGGNSFTTAASIGTNDAFSLSIKAGGTTAMTVSNVDGSTTFNRQAVPNMQTTSVTAGFNWDVNAGNVMNWTAGATGAATVNMYNVKAGGQYMLTVSGSGTGQITVACFSGN